VPALAELITANHPKPTPYSKPPQQNLDANKTCITRKTNLTNYRQHKSVPTKNVQSFPNLRVHRTVLILIYSAHSQTSVYTTCSQIWGQCIVRCTILCLIFAVTHCTYQKNGQVVQTWVTNYVSRCLKCSRTDINPAMNYVRHK